MSRYKAYPVYRDSGVEWLGTLPEHWDVKRLRFVADPKNSNVDKKTYEGQSEVRLCNYTDVYYNETITSALDFMQSTASELEIGAFSLLADDVIITKDSETADDIGIPAYVPEVLPGVVCGYHLTMLRSHGVEGEFLFRILQAQSTKAYFFVEVCGVTRFGLGQDAIKNIVVPLPGRDEQQRLCRWIGRETTGIEGMVNKKTRFIELLREKRQALITHAVTKGLDPNVTMKDSGVEWLGEVPEHWEVKKLRHISKIVRGASPRPAGDPKYFTGENEDGKNMPWLTVAEITKDNDTYVLATSSYLTPLGVTQSQIFNGGTLVFSNSGATLGVPKILAIDCCANDGVLAFKGLSSFVDIRFMYYFLSTTTERLRDEMQKGGQPNLNTDIVKSMSFPAAPIDEQVAVVTYLVRETARIATLITKTERSIELLKERRSALITAAVTGKIDVRESTAHQNQLAA